jgi:Tfp pilus assembly protein PilO
LTDEAIDDLLRQLVEPSEVDALLAALERLG